MSGDEVTFGPFRFDVARRELSHDGSPVRLGGRALDILCVLAAAKGEVVGKDELLTRVWPGVVIEENNLQVQVSALRKALERGQERPELSGYRSRPRIPADRPRRCSVGSDPSGQALDRGSAVPEHER